MNKRLRKALVTFMTKVSEYIDYLETSEYRREAEKIASRYAELTGKELDSRLKNKLVKDAEFRRVMKEFVGSVDDSYTKLGELGGYPEPKNAVERFKSWLMGNDY